VTRRPDWLVEQLPVSMTEDRVLVQLVRILQEVADTVAEQVDNLPHMFDVTVAPDAIVRLIGSWLGMNWVDSDQPDWLQRRIVRQYSANMLQRGTRDGLTKLVELLCDAPDQVVVEDSGGVFTDNRPVKPPHVTVSAPGTGWVQRDDLVRIVQSELPAIVTFDLIIGGELVHSTRADTAAAGAA